MTAPTVLVCGVPVHDCTLDEAVDHVGEMVDRGRATGRGHQVATVNLDFLANAGDDPTLRGLLQRADLAVADGMPVVWGSRWVGTPLRERVAGADLVPALARRGAEEGWSLYLLGGAPGVADRVANDLRSTHPELVVTADAGPRIERPEDTDPTALRRIRDAAPDVLLVALGHPKQERWIDHHRDRLGVPVMVGVGASLDFLAGVQRRAPEWMQRSGTEWLYRAVHEPARLVPRYTRDLVRMGPRLAREVALQRSRRARHRGPVPALDVDLGAIAAGEEVVIDLAGWDTLDPRDVTRLVDTVKDVTQGGGEVVLASVPAAVMRRLLDLQLYDFVPTTSRPPAATGAPR